jgi:toxin CcdB
MPRQFDVVANPDPEEAARRPYLLVLQSDLVSGLASTVVAPLVVREMMKGADQLNPVMVIEGREYWLATHELFAVERRVLRSAVANLDAQRYAIIAALDLLFTGF